VAPREGDPLQAIEAVREDTNIPEAAAFMGDNPVVDTMDRLARARRDAEADAFNPASGWEAYSYNQARRQAGLPERAPPGEATYTGGPYEQKRDTTQETEATPAQRVFDAFSAFHPTESGAVNPIPTDKQMASAIFRAPGAGEFIDKIARKEDTPDAAPEGGGWVDSIKKLFGIKPGEAALPPPGQPTGIPLPQPRPGGAPMRSYPDDAQAEFAKKNEFGYGSVADPYINQQTARIWAHINSIPQGKGKPPKEIVTPYSGVGRTTQEIMAAIADAKHVDLNAPQYRAARDRIGQTYTKAAIAVEGSGVAKLGFDPKQIVADVSGVQTSLSGAYTPATDPNTGKRFPDADTDPATGQIYANVADPSVLVHESMHRGLDQLRQRNPEAAKIMASLPLSEESVVRYLMIRHAGDAERFISGTEREDKGRNAALAAVSNSYFGPGYQAKIDRLEELAAEEVAKKRPGGPR